MLRTRRLHTQLSYALRLRVTAGFTLVRGTFFPPQDLINFEDGTRGSGVSYREVYNRVLKYG